MWGRIYREKNRIIMFSCANRSKTEVRKIDLSNLNVIKVVSCVATSKRNITFIKSQGNFRLFRHILC